MDFSIKLPWPEWEPVKVLGTGGFGAVYEIRRDMFGKTEHAAVKVLSIPRDEDEITQFRAEGYDEESISAHYRDTLREIVQEYSLMLEVKGNTNVVCCDDLRYVPRENGIGWDIFIKMELLKPLNKTLTAQYREEDVIRLGMDLCNALTLCRQKGIVHRDIKPANIFVSRTGDYKLGDFGIAKFSDKTTQGTRIGTYEFMAPEVYNNRPYGAAADIYCLGLVLYWMMNQRRTPFLPLPPQIPTSSEREHAGHLRYSGQPLLEPAHGSPELKRIVLKACAFAPEARYATAEALRQDLERLERITGPGVIVDTPTDEWDQIFTTISPEQSDWQPPVQQPPQWAQPPVQQPPVQQPPVYVMPEPVRPNPVGNPVWNVTPPQPLAAPAKKKQPVWLWIVLAVIALGALIGVGILLAGALSQPQDGWVTKNGEKYYYRSGQAVTGWNTVEGTTRYFNADGSLPDRTPEYPVVDLYVSNEAVTFDTNSDIDWTTAYLMPESPIYDCIKLDYSITVHSESGHDCRGQWALYVLTMDGNWVQAGVFDMTDDYAITTFYFDEPISFQAFAGVYLDTPESADFTCDHKLMNVRYVAES